MNGTAGKIPCVLLFHFMNGTAGKIPCVLLFHFLVSKIASGLNEYIGIENTLKPRLFIS
jgi:hypothetical protein